jgi:DNA ligase (NAD+)
VTKKETQKRIEKLKKVIKHHRYLYHVLNKQEISPSALDSLKHELYKLETQFPEFITPDSPTQRVAGKPLEGFKKIKHQFPMLSIEDIFSEKELKEWKEYLKRLMPTQEFSYFAELKIDGFAVTLIYENGLFALGATRGDGKTGEDVTQNLKTIESIPLRLEIREKMPNKIIQEKAKKLIQGGKIEIRGEVYMEKKKFKKLNQELKRRGERTYSNPRNLAAGSIRQLDPKLAASRPLDFLAYDIVTDLGQKTHSEEHQIFPLLGFKTDKGKKCKNLDEVIDFWKKNDKKRDAFPFEIDGVVVSVNQNSFFQKIGVAGKSPRGIRAFKFSPKQTTTEIKDIKIQVGRTGAITPVAILEPVEIGGVKISRATLHNEDEIKRLKVKIGDTAIISRAGDVIPDVIKVLPELRTGKEKKFEMPKKCPVCNTNLVKPEGEAVWRCPNPNCSARQRKYFYHFISKKAFDIVGLGPKIIDKLIKESLISDPADLFILEEGDLLPLEGFAQKAAQKLIESIQSKKAISLSKFIYALGIRNVGEETAQDLVRHFDSLKAIKKSSLGEIEEIRGLGPVVARSIYQFFQKKQNLKFIEKLKKAGVKIKKFKKEIKSQKLKEFTFVLTGTLESMTREAAKRKIRELGGDISESISEKTDFLIVGQKPGSKFEKAKKLRVKIIQEQEFLKMIK